MQMIHVQFVVFTSILHAEHTHKHMTVHAVRCDDLCYSMYH